MMRCATLNRRRDKDTAPVETGLAASLRKEYELRAQLIYATINVYATINACSLACVRDFHLDLFPFELCPGPIRKAQAHSRRILQLGQLHRGESFSGWQLRRHRNGKGRLGSADLPQRALALSNSGRESGALDAIRA